MSLKNYFNFFLILFISHNLRAENKSWENIYKDNKSSVSLIISQSGICSGALVEADLILTAAHCVSGLRPVSVSWQDGLGKYVSAKTVALDTESDLAFLRIAKSDRRPITVLPEKQLLEVGQTIATIGHPTSPSMKSKDPGFFNQEETYLLSTGVVSGLAESDYITDMSVSPGNSGGPAFDQAGQIAGVVSRKRVGFGVGNIGYVVKNSEIHKLKAKILVDPEYEVPWYKAKTNFHIDLRWAGHNYLKTVPVTNTYLFSLGTVLDLWDRLRLEGEFNFDTSPNSRIYSLGYNFAFDMKNRSTIYLVPSYESINFSWKNNGLTETKSATGFGLSLYWTQFPFRFKYLNYTLDANNYSVLSLQLPFL